MVVWVAFFFVVAVVALPLLLLPTGKPPKPPPGPPKTKKQNKKQNTNRKHCLGRALRAAPQVRTDQDEKKHAGEKND